MRQGKSSCDDTAAAVVTSDGKVLGEAIATQAELHAPWGGVVPNLAQQAHKDAIDRIVTSALSQAQLQPSSLDAIAVTIGPGLSLCLDVGVRKAHALSRTHNIPIVQIHHMEAHALVARMAAGGSEALPFPFLCLLVSGGHNLLVLVKGVGSYVQLGTTLDDALGEAYDKVARMLGLDLKPNGGAALEAIARQGNPDAFAFGVPMKKYGNCDFSYAGLKTSVRLCIEKNLGSAEGAGKRATVDLQQQAAAAAASEAAASSSSSEAADEQQQQQQQQMKADIAASFQKVAVQHLVMRLKRAITWAREECPELQHLVVAGGVASNQYVRQQVSQVAEASGMQLVLPPARWCTDNGVMVGWAGVERYRLGLVQPPAPQLPADGSPEWVELRPRWPLTSNKHAKSMPPVLSMKRPDNNKHAKSMPPVLSMKKPDKSVVSLTDLTQQELAAAAAEEGSSSEAAAAAATAAAAAAAGAGAGS
ncbi:hypothetical protein OEZ86_014187 [Tetradesmus obliquus]|nr:hypothetical protein OEZ86_014187 [Tetradesmus obliquus]